MCLLRGIVNYDLNRIPGVVHHGGFHIRQKGTLGEAVKGRSKDGGWGGQSQNVLKGYLEKFVADMGYDCPPPIIFL